MPARRVKKTKTKQKVVVKQKQKNNIHIHIDNSKKTKGRGTTKIIHTGGGSGTQIVPIPQPQLIPIQQFNPTHPQESASAPVAKPTFYTLGQEPKAWFDSDNIIKSPVSSIFDELKPVSIGDIGKFDTSSTKNSDNIEHSPISPIFDELKPVNIGDIGKKKDPTLKGAEGAFSSVASGKDFDETGTLTAKTPAKKPIGYIKVYERDGKKIFFDPEYFGRAGTREVKMFNKKNRLKYTKLGYEFTFTPIE